MRCCWGASPHTSVLKSSRLHICCQAVVKLLSSCFQASHPLAVCVQVQRGIDGCCKQLMATLSDHSAACKAFDAAVVWHAQGSSSSNAGSPTEQQRHRRTASAESGGGSRRSSMGSWGGGASMAGKAAAAVVLRPRFNTAPTLDPWCSEGRLLAEQQALKRWQVCP
jgi:hypothetical protein